MKPSEFIREHTPFRYRIFRVDEYEKWREANPRHTFSTSLLASRIPSLYTEAEANNLWVTAFFRGREYRIDAPNPNWETRSTAHYTREGWTYWYTLSQTKPSFDDSVHSLFQDCLDAWECNSVLDYLIHLREMETDLNKLDLKVTEYRYEMMCKMYGALAELLGNAYTAYEQYFDGKSAQVLRTAEFERFVQNYREFVEY